MNQNLSGDSEQTPVSSQAVVERTDRAVTETADAIHHTEDRAKLRLQKALDCLDVRLEDELSRFRARQAHRSIDTPPIIGTLAWEPQSVSAPVETDENVIFGEIVKSGIVVGETITRGGESIGLDEMTPPNANPHLATMVNVDDRSSFYADYTEAENATAAENIDVNFSLRGEIAPFHVGYLASSQELLDREQIEATDESNDVFEDPADSYKVVPQPQFFTFRKLSLMAMAWAVAGGAAYAYFNPNILAPLTAKVSTPTIATTSSVEQSIQSPNLAANEFTELNLSTINTIKLPTATTATNVTPATTTASVANPSAAPVAIPYKGTNATTGMPQPAPITAQPQLADSLVKSLLPPNFHNFAKRVRTTQAMRTGQ